MRLCVFDSFDLTSGGSMPKDHHHSQHPPPRFTDSPTRHSVGGGVSDWTKPNHTQPNKPNTRTTHPPTTRRMKKASVAFKKPSARLFQRVDISRLCLSNVVDARTITILHHFPFQLAFFFCQTSSLRRKQFPIAISTRNGPTTVSPQVS